jgi:LuxR family maltose regulon positive regulatory protein
VVLARLKLAREDVAGAAALLAEADWLARQQSFVRRLPEVVAAQVLLLLRQGSLSAAADLAHVHDLPLSQARVALAQGDPSAALARLLPWRQQVEAKDWKDERLKVLVLQAVALQAGGEQEKAVQALRDALVLAEPASFIRLFVDEGLPMAHLLSNASASGIMPEYIGKVLAVFDAEQHRRAGISSWPAAPSSQPQFEPLSHRELEVLHLIAQGLSNQEIGERLVLALDTVKGHNRSIFGKLQVQRRTEAIARARELGLL